MNSKKPSKTKPAKTGHKKVFDVVRPGAAPASATSRPVIPSANKPVADDQFVPSTSRILADDPDEKRALMDSSKKVSLQPIISGAEKDKPSHESAKKAELPAALPGEHEAFSAPLIDKATLAGAAKTPEKSTPETASDVSKIDAQAMLEHLAVEQVVEQPAHEEPVDDSGATETFQSTDEKVSHAKSIDELLAETGAPQLDTPTQSSKPLVSYHRRHHSFWQILLMILCGAAIGIIALNFLLDAEIIKTTLDLPYTDWL